MPDRTNNTPPPSDDDETVEIVPPPAPVNPAGWLTARKTRKLRNRMPVRRFHITAEGGRS
jgi:hypothetical protein